MVFAGKVGKPGSRPNTVLQIADIAQHRTTGDHITRLIDHATKLPFDESVVDFGRLLDCVYLGRLSRRGQLPRRRPNRHHR